MKTEPRDTALPENSGIASYFARYLWWGAQRKGLLDNLLYFNPAFYMLSEREDIKQRFDRFLQKPLSIIGAAHAWTARQDDPHAIEAERLFEQYSHDPAVDSVSPDVFDGRLHSVIVRFKRGGYYRIVLDSDYFIRKKGEVKDRWGRIQIDPANYRMFEEALHIFKANNVRLLVNEMEEAPFMYADKQWNRDSENC